MAYLARGRFRELEAALAAEVQAAQSSDALQPVTVVVGSALLRAHLVRALAQRLGAFVNVEVVTLFRLAVRLAGHSAGMPLSRLAQERLVARLVDARATRRPWYFAPVAGTPGLGRALLATIEDLRESLVEPHGVAAAVSGESLAKGRDLAELYGQYVAALQQGGLADAPAIYSAAADAAQGPSVLGAPVLMLYGFYDLPQMQAELIRALGAHRSLIVFMPQPACGVTFSAGSEELFAEATDGACPLAPPADASTLDWLCRRLFTAAAQPALPPADDGSLRILSVADDGAEATEAARQLLASAASGTPFWDMAVIVADRDAAVAAATSLRRLGLPVACRLPDQGRAGRAVALLLDCLAPAAGPQLARRAVIDLAAAAAAGDAAAPAAEQARWSDESRQANVVGGAEQWRDRLARRRRYYEARLGELEAGHDEETEDLVAETAAERAGVAAVDSLQQFVERLAATGAALPATASWAQQADAFCASLAALALVPDGDELLAEVRALRELDQVQPTVAFAEFAATVRRLMADRRQAWGTVGRDGVAVLTVEEVRGLAFHTVVFCGLSEGGFPPRPRQDPLLLDEERAAINAHVGGHLPLKSEREVESQVLFALALEAARARAVLVSPRLEGATGRPRLPSRFLLRVCDALAGRPVALGELEAASLFGGIWRRVPASAAAATAGALESARAGSTAALPATALVDEREFDVGTLLAGGRADGQRRARSGARGLAYLRALWGEQCADRRWGRWGSEFAATVGSWDGVLQSQAALVALGELDPLSRPQSPTALQTFVDCPFAYYVRYVLGMQPPEEPAEAAEVEPQEIGTVAHAILQGVFAQMYRDGLSAEEAPALLRRVAAACCKRAEDEGVVGLPLAWQARRRMLLDDLGTAVRLDLERLQADDRRPWQFEWPFGSEVERPVFVELDGRRLELRGRIDRLDRSADGSRVRLIDYKTGGGDAERRTLRGGRNVQLAAYMLAAQQTMEPRPAEVACEFRFVTRRGAFRTLSPAEDAASVAATFTALVARVVAAVESGMFVRSAADQRCRYCDLAYACGVSDWARERKRGDEALRPVRELQSGDLREPAADA